MTGNSGRHKRYKMHAQCIRKEESEEASFAEVGSASLDVVQAGTEAHRRWAYYLMHPHCLGRRVVGQNIGYLARDRFGREVAGNLCGMWALRGHLMESACGQFQHRLKRRGQFEFPRGLDHMLTIDVAVKNDTLQFLPSCFLHLSGMRPVGARIRLEF